VAVLPTGGAPTAGQTTGWGPFKSKGALTAAITGGVVVVALVITVIVLALTRGGNDEWNATPGGGGQTVGLPSLGQTPPPVDTEETPQVPPTEEPTPDVPPTEVPSPEVPPPTEEPTPEPPPNPDPPDDGLYRSENLGVVFAVPEGWEPGEDEAVITLSSPTLTSGLVVSRDTATSYADYAANPEALISETAAGAEADDWEYIADNPWEDLLGRTWLEISGVLYKGEDVYPMQFYVLDDGAGGSFVVCAMQTPESPPEELSVIDALIASLTAFDS
jgi:hypothetical protein